MDKNEGLKIKGRWRIIPYYKGTNRIAKHLIKEGENLITTVGKNMVGDMLIDTSGWDTGFTYHGIGTGSTTPVVGNTTMNTEVKRKALSSKSRSVNVLTLSTFFPVADCTYDIQECGIFGHSTATSTIDTGVLFSHYLSDFDNSGGNYDLTFEYILTIG